MAYEGSVNFSNCGSFGLLSLSIFGQQHLVLQILLSFVNSMPILDGADKKITLFIS